MPLDEAGGEYVFHIAGVEEGIVQTVELCVHLRVFYGFGHIFYTNDLPCLPRHEIGNGARAGVKVVDEFVAGEGGKVTRHLIQFIGLLGICLVKTLRPYLETQPFHGFVDKRSAGEGDDIEVANRIVALRVVDIQQRGHFGECSVQMLQECLCLRLVVSAAHAELHEEHDFARG